MKNILVLTVITTLLLTLIACGGDKPNSPSAPNTTAAPAKAIPKAPTSALATKLYANFHATPSTQAQKDENQLIEYAIEKNLDVEKTSSGLYYIVHEKGKGQPYVHGQPCKAHYSGYTLDGKIFDSSYKRNNPLMFNVGQMIPGWNEALKFMNTGTKAQLLIPSHLAYGPNGFPGLIAPHTPLVFDMEILPLLATE